METIIYHWYDRLLSMLLTLLGFGGTSGLVGCIYPVAYGGPPEDYDVKLVPNNLSFSSEGGTAKVKVETEGKWYVSKPADYVRFSQTTGQGTQYVDVTVTENITIDQRYMQVVVSGQDGYYTAILNIYQEASR